MNHVVRMLPRECKYHMEEELDQVIFISSLLTSRVLENRDSHLSLNSGFLAQAHVAASQPGPGSLYLVPCCLPVCSAKVSFLQSTLSFPLHSRH